MDRSGERDQTLELECYSRSRGVEGQPRCRAFYVHVSVSPNVTQCCVRDVMIMLFDHVCDCASIHAKARIKEEKYSMKPAVELSKRSHHIIHLHYPLVLQNVLPFTIDVVENSSSTEKRTLTPGETTHYSHAIIINDPRFLITVSTCTYIMWAIKYHYIAPPPQLFAP